MSKNKEKITILGIDPGTRVTGYAVVETNFSTYSSLDYGSICPPSHLPLAKRYLIIHRSIESLLQKHAIDALAIENQYAGKNFQSILKLGMAKGVIILSATKLNIPTYEYSPAKAKLAVVGNGRASKEQVSRMVKVLFGLSDIPRPADAADALALAFCHLNHIKYQRMLYV